MMKKTEEQVKWVTGVSPVTVVMISLNEAHNMHRVLNNLSGWAKDIYLIDSFSTDATVSIAKSYGVNVIQRAFKGFGDQWNFALSCVPESSEWTMKIDPDETLDKELKSSISIATLKNDVNGIVVERRLRFMTKTLPVSHNILRIWRTGICEFTDVLVNEHPIVDGLKVKVSGILDHYDSPNIHHWLAKQNQYTSAEARAQNDGLALGVEPNLFGDSLARRMWIKKYFWKIPGRFVILYLYHLLWLGSWRAGRVGFIWAHLRTEVYRIWEIKALELKLEGGGLPKNKK